MRSSTVWTWGVGVEARLELGNKVTAYETHQCIHLCQADIGSEILHLKIILSRSSVTVIKWNQHLIK